MIQIIKFIVDGVWRIDPLRPIICSGGYKNNLLIVPYKIAQREHLTPGFFLYIDSFPFVGLYFPSNVALVLY